MTDAFKQRLHACVQGCLCRCTTRMWTVMWSCAVCFPTFPLVLRDKLFEKWSLSRQWKLNFNRTETVKGFHFLTPLLCFTPQRCFIPCTKSLVLRFSDGRHRRHVLSPAWRDRSSLSGELILHYYARTATQKICTCFCFFFIFINLYFVEY